MAVPGPDHARGEGRGAARRLQSEEGEKVGLVMFLTTPPPTSTNYINFLSFSILVLFRVF